MNRQYQADLNDCIIENFIMYFCATGENIQQKSSSEENQFVMMLCPVVSITKVKAYEYLKSSCIL